jgi:uncharacterized protein YfaS (alpha-2-macroglobulin family)
MRDSDGGITYWGRGEADTALTAYALKFATDARDVFDVDADVADDARDWLLKHQRADGAWPAPEWQGKGEQQTVLLTAYVARILAESGVKARLTASGIKEQDAAAKTSGASESAKKSDAGEGTKQSGVK